MKVIQLRGSYATQANRQGAKPRIQRQASLKFLLPLVALIVGGGSHAVAQSRNSGSCRKHCCQSNGCKGDVQPRRLGRVSCLCMTIRHTNVLFIPGFDRLFRRRRRSDIALVIVNRGKDLGLHDIGIKPATKMIDLVMQWPQLTLYGARCILLRRSVYLGSCRRFFTSGSTLMSGSPASRCL